MSAGKTTRRCVIAVQQDETGASRVLLARAQDSVDDSLAAYHD